MLLCLSHISKLKIKCPTSAPDTSLPLQTSKRSLLKLNRWRLTAIDFTREQTEPVAATWKMTEIKVAAAPRESKHRLQCEKCHGLNGGSQRCRQVTDLDVHLSSACQRTGCRSISGPKFSAKWQIGLYSHINMSKNNSRLVKKSKNDTLFAYTNI